MVSKQIIQKFKLNHGLFLNGYEIKPSKQAMFSEDGVLNISSYKGQPLVYTSINTRSYTSLPNIEFDETLQPSDLCINFPVAEITYDANLLESFSNFMGDDETLHEVYGHSFARKVLVGGKLFIDYFKSATPTHIDIFKSVSTWTYDSAKYCKESPFSHLSDLDFWPKIRTSDGEM